MNVYAENAMVIAEQNPGLFQDEHGLSNPAQFAHVSNVAELLANSDILPPDFAGKPANCAVAIFQAMRLKEDPLTLMQHMHLIHGRPGYSTTYLIARARQAGFRLAWTVTEEEPKVTFGGKSWPNIVVVCALSHLDDGELGEERVDLWWAHAEGYTTKKNSKYQTMPERMLKYRSATAVLRLYAPEVMLGLAPAEELADVAAAQFEAAAGLPSADVAALESLVAGVLEDRTADTPKAEPADIVNVAAEPVGTQADTEEPPNPKKGKAKMTEEEKNHRKVLVEEIGELEASVRLQPGGADVVKSSRSTVFNSWKPRMGASTISKLEAHKAALYAALPEPAEISAEVEAAIAAGADKAAEGEALAKAAEAEAPPPETKVSMALTSQLQKGMADLDAVCAQLPDTLGDPKKMLLGISETIGEKGLPHEGWTEAACKVYLTHLDRAVARSRCIVASYAYRGAVPNEERGEVKGRLAAWKKKVGITVSLRDETNTARMHELEQLIEAATADLGEL